jgi:hypothetical protein
MTQEYLSFQDVNFRYDNYNFCPSVSGGMYSKYLLQILCFWHNP